MTGVPILTAKQCRGRIRRLAMQIWEENAEAKQLFILGIAGQGAAIAQELWAELKERAPFTLGLGTIEIDKHTAIPHMVTITGIALDQLATTPLVLVDDVLNTGRILSYAFAALLPYGPPKIEVAVLVARNHSLFPIKPDFVGHSLSTTLEEHIEVRLGEGAFLS